jgi:diguanylate cyclase (GGDEF)-like protein
VAQLVSTPPPQPEAAPPSRRLGAWLRRFITPDGAHDDVDGRRARMLGWMLLTLNGLVAATLVLVLGVDTGERRILYVALVGGLLGLLILAFFANKRGRYAIAARLTVACVVLGPWCAIVLDPSVLHGDFVPLVYIALSIFLCSILLSVRMTVLFAGMQFLALLFFPLFVPATATINWPSLLAFIVFTAMLGVVANYMHRKDLEQIDRQKQLLEENEAMLRDLSVRDPLTGLFNRRYMEETLARELLRAARKTSMLGIIMLDVDHFKRFNDRYGHGAGDLLLREMGKTLRTQIRGGDIVCRYGGEEFLLILPEASLETTRARAESVRQSVAALHLLYESLPLDPVTISLGVAVYPQHGDTADLLVRTADTALYQAKANGRNQVVVAE